jgi:hypothetical protein
MAGPVGNVRFLELSQERNEKTVNNRSGDGCAPPMLSDEIVIIGVRADPEPQNVIVHRNAQSAVMHPDTDRPIPADLLKMQ